MTKKKLSIDKSVIELERKQKEHIGANGISSDGLPVHLPVDADNDGFATTKMYKQHQQLFKQRERTPNKTDILKLEPGYYEGSQFLNHPAGTTPDTPTTWISYINVNGGDDGRRDITVMDSFSGLFWRRTIHTGGDPISGSGAWIEYYGLVTLWSGYSKLTSEINLNSAVFYDDGTAKYRNIMVQYLTDTGNSGLALGTVNGVLINSSNLNNKLSLAAPDFHEAELAFPTSNTAKIIRNKRINMYTHTGDKAIYAQVMAGAINIQKIMGVM